jgi:NAD(P)-dependent dehydrogenase (short-subunit alcohol dehydrogenase family)
LSAEEKRSSAVAGRRIVIAGASGPGAGIANGLSARGAEVFVVAPAAAVAALDPGVGRIACTLSTEVEVTDAMATAVDRLGAVDQFVYSWYPAQLTTKATFTELTETEWAATCEGTLGAAWWSVRALIRPMKAGGGGSMVFVVPTVGMSGAANFVMLSTVSEGLRMLAKGCGRCWGADGVIVNTLATSPSLWVSPEHGDRLLREISLSVPAMGQVGDPAEDLAPLVGLMGDGDAHFLTASTLVADGGLWMGL